MNQPIPPVDPGNRYLGPVLCDLTCSRGTATDQSTGLTEDQAIITVRAGNATLTVMLNKAELSAWIDNLAGTRDKMTGLTLAGHPLPDVRLPGNGAQR